jgi:hypothetical protein
MKHPDKMNKVLYFLTVLLLILSPYGKANDNRWKINSDGSISWKIDDRLPHDEHIEMSGQMISTVIRYGVKSDRSFHFTRSIIWPMLRTIPNDTHASLMRLFDQDIISAVNINGKLKHKEEVTEIILNGFLIIKSFIDPGIELTRTLFPSIDKPVYCETYTLVNRSGRPVMIEIPGYRIVYITGASKGVYGSYRLTAETTGSGAFTLMEGEMHSFDMIFKGEKMNESLPQINVASEEQQRQTLINEWWNNLVLETPDEILNQTFAFAKIRTSESIYRTKGGLMHGPGGESYYAAIWANDQAEYVGPFFPFLGYQVGNEASLNAYLHFARFMNPEYKPIPSSIIAEGTDIWNGAGDRGDAAMIAYGAARFALASGDRQTAEQLWPLIEWCLEYCKRNRNDDGVVTSDSDELEGRFPSGNANLCTSSLCYDALLSAVYLGKSLDKPDRLLNEYTGQEKAMRSAIEGFFGAEVEGFKTYRYYEGNDILRSWICIPLTVGIFNRKKGTIDALFSPRLWTRDGLLTQAGDDTFWDRSTLYALRGVFAAGEREKALEYLKYYSNRRLLGDHVPYPVEAYPEGNQRHLSAESGLYCRIYTEGVFGSRPTGLHSFSITPQLPEEWNEMALRKIHAFGNIFDIKITRKGEKLEVVVKSDKVEITRLIKDGDKTEIKL